MYHKIDSFLFMCITLCLCVAIIIYSSESVQAQENTSDLKPAYTDLGDSIKEAMQAETEKILELKDELKRLQGETGAIETELNAYKILLSIHGNFLLLPNLQTKNLEKALGDNQVALTNIVTRIKDYSQKRDAVASLIQQTDERIDINKKQLNEIVAVKEAGKELQSVKLGLGSLINKLSEKREILKKALKIHSTFVDEINGIHTSLTELSARFNEQIKARKKQQFLERKKIPIASLTWPQIMSDFVQLKQQFRKLILKETWAKELRVNWKSSRAYIITFLIFLGVIQYLLVKFRIYLRGLTNQADKQSTSNTLLIQELLQRSILLTGTTLLAYIFLASNVLFDTAPFFRLVYKILLITLMTRWGKHFAVVCFKEKGWLNTREVSHISTLCYAIRYLAILYAIVEWLTSSETVLLILFRFMAEILLLVWVVGFWKKLRNRMVTELKADEKMPSSRITILSGWTYTVVGAGLMLDLVGYQSLSVYWLSNWGITTIILLWALMSFLTLQEWRLRLKTEAVEISEAFDRTRQPFRWLLLQVSWILWLLGIIFLLIFVWGGKQTVIVNMIHWLNYPISIGSISFSAINFVYAFMILVVTHMLIRIWRYVLSEKILVESGLDSGLQDSIVTVTVYTFWVFGILLSLHILGFGTTTLALAFGALGIGLGFGLQNIFNNFISGIILLFERPIQVGDDVEINGIWATVKKINVRATVVQTYDNASLIIPNSEFISSQVINWSFKDKRLRRNVDVGVAYGSEIELVRETLLEIAANTPKVFKNPKPDVLFRDFGDSSLVFRLRIWTDIDNMLKAETAIRFEIDRLFKEKGIVIAFPQRDVHLFTDTAPQAVGAMNREEKTQ